MPTHRASRIRILKEEKIAKLPSLQYSSVTRQLHDGIRNRQKRGSGSAPILHGVARSVFGLVDR